MYRIKVISEEDGKRICSENKLKLIKFYEGRGKFNKGKLMMDVELIEFSDIKYVYIFERADGLYFTDTFGSYFRSSAKLFNLTICEAINKLNSLNEDNCPTWILHRV